MTTPAAPPSDAPSPDAAPRAAGWARPELEQDLAVLARLRDAALAMAEAVAAQAQDRAQGPREPVADDTAAGAEPPPPPAPAFTGDLVLAFARASRAVRMTCALRARLIDEADRLDDVQGRRAYFQRAEARRERKAQVARLLTRIIEDETFSALDDDADLSADWGAEAEAAEAEGVERGENENDTELRLRLIGEASESLRDSDRFGDVLDRPVSEFIDAICRDLGLAPDWRRLAEEAWAREEIASGRVGAPFLSLPLDGGGIKGGGGAAPAKRTSRRPARTDRPTEAPSPAVPPQAETLPPPIPALSPIQGERIQGPEPPPEPIGLPGEYPPPRRPRPRPPNALSPDWGWTPTRS